MTRLQELEIRASEIRERLNELSTRDEALSDEERAEVGTLRTEFRDVETKRRAAIEAEAEAAQADPAAEGTGEGAEIERLSVRARVGEFLRLAVAGSAPAENTAERELQEAVEAPALGPNGGVVVPWRAMLTGTGRHRADAETDTGDLEGGEIQRPILRRLFGRSVFGALGVRVDQVPAGRAEYVLLSGGVTAAQTEEGTAKDAEAASFSTQTLKPKRLTARYLWSVEQSAQVGDELEAGFRMDLGDAILSQMSAQAVNGNGTAPNITGILARIAAPDDPGNEADYGTYAALAAQAVDGIHAESERETSVLLGVASYKHAAGKIAANGSKTGLAALRESAGMVQATAYLPAPASDIQAVILHGAGMMGEDRGDSVAAMWGAGPELIRDPYGSAPEGRVALTALSLWDAYMAFRAAYTRGKLKLAA